MKKVCAQSRGEKVQGATLRLWPLARAFSLELQMVTHAQ